MENPVSSLPLELFMTGFPAAFTQPVKIARPRGPTGIPVINDIQFC